MGLVAINGCIYVFEFENLLRVNHYRNLGKEATFAECCGLSAGKVSLPSDVASGLSKEAPFVECLLVHSAKVLTKGPAGDLFAER
jgi:hypothetical protein